ncbi:DUF6348 family protein [Verrucomicrobium sp. BvORR106]|uniref:DUF6348 family protein n=1 Tax=Verrucomicrobium sp. BvORR106 TaxID=1403819 RepID=UPI00068AEBC7|nr:DUF6348 family protein [Verrucomicrobium sp. BvORR106]
MFRWFKQKQSITPPQPDPENPGRGHTIKVGFANGDRSWTEEADLLSSLAEALSAAGHSIVRRKSWIEVNRDFTIMPQVIAVHPLEDGGVRTSSTLQVAHRTLVPAGVFEYQYATGDDIKSALQKAFETWAASDLPVFLDALIEKPDQCMTMQMTSDTPAGSDGDRRVIFGPPAHAVSYSSLTNEESHDFCPCCLFTNTHEAFKEILAGTSFHGIRLFAVRNADGSLEADCRVDGREWQAGEEALLQYAETWPDRGFEYRKQYVGIQNWPGQSAPS